MVDFSAFADELTKLSSRKLNLKELGEYARRLSGHPGHSYLTREAIKTKNVKALKELTRADAPLTTVPVPPKTRLELFKHWKEHGTLPRVSRGGQKVVFPPDLFTYRRTNKPMKLVHGGEEKTIKEMLVRPAGGADHGPFLIPGQTEATHMSTYTFHGPAALKGSQSYARGGAKMRGGKPVTVELTIPEKHLLINKERGEGALEVIVPAFGRSLKSISSKPPVIKQAAGYDPKRVKKVKSRLDAFMKKNKLKGDAVVLAGTSMYLHGLRPTLRDIDVHIPSLKGFKSEIHRGIEVDAGGRGPKRWVKNAVNIGGVQAQSIPDLIAFKKKMGRPKDLVDIKILKEYLARG